jgi:anti-sigma B factor antagonist
VDNPGTGEAFAKPDGDRTCVVIAGEVDMLTTPHLDDVILSAVAGAARGVDVDMSGVVFIASTGLRSLVAGAKAAKAKGIEFRFGKVSGAARRTLELTGFSTGDWAQLT